MAADGTSETNCQVDFAAMMPATCADRQDVSLLERAGLTGWHILLLPDERQRFRQHHHRAFRRRLARGIRLVHLRLPCGVNRD